MVDQTHDEFEQSSYLAGGNSAYIEMMYEQYLKDPASVPTEWQDFFNEVRTDDKGVKEAPISHADVIEVMKHSQAIGGVQAAPIASSDKQEAVDRLIQSFRNIGHLQAQIDPLKIKQIKQDPRLDLKSYGLNQQDLQESFLTRGVCAAPTATLTTIFDQLKKTYCNTVGFQFEYIIDEQQRLWLENYIESEFWQAPLSKEIKMNALNSLIAANGLEQFLEVKYPGQKRFSVEGLDAMIPALNYLVEQAADASIDEVVLCMAHRGRLNVMVNVVGKTVASLCDDFAGKSIDANTTGDVKYHMGYSSDVKIHDNQVHLSLLFNPSHLDYIAPVLLGSVRGRQDLQTAHSDKTNYALVCDVAW